MTKIETNLTYKLTNYEEAAYLLSKYFIERDFEADVIAHKEKAGGYISVISKQGLIKDLLGSRTVFEVTFAPEKATVDQKSFEGSCVWIESKVMTEGFIKELATYLLIIPALKKISDYTKILNICKRKSLEICEKLKTNDYLKENADNITKEEKH